MRIMVLDPAGNLWDSERVLLDFLGSSATGQHRVALCCPPNTPLVDRGQGMAVRVFPDFQARPHQRGKLERLRAMVGLLRAWIEHRSELISVIQAGATRIAALAMPSPGPI